MSVPVLTHRRDLRQGDLVFPEEILRIGHTLDFQLDCVSKEVQQEVFGPELDTSSLCDWLNLHTAYDFALQDVADHIEITLCRNFGKKAHPFLYPLNRAERDVLRGEMEACCQRRTDRSLAQQYSHLLTTEEAEPPELTVGTHRLPMGEVGFAEDLSECGGLLQFYMPVTFDPDAVFGTHVATAENDDWLNVYAAYDLNASRPCSALDVILVCGDGNEFAFRYPLAKQEQAALLEKMDAYCLEQTGMALADFRARYLVGGTAAPPGPQPGPAVSTPSAPCAPCVPVSGRGRARAPPRRETAPLGPVSPRFGAFDFSTRIKGGGRKRPPPAHKAPQCGAFPDFRPGGRNGRFRPFGVVGFR